MSTTKAMNCTNNDFQEDLRVAFNIKDECCLKVILKFKLNINLFLVIKVDLHLACFYTGMLIQA